MSLRSPLISILCQAATTGTLAAGTCQRVACTAGLSTRPADVTITVDGSAFNVDAGQVLASNGLLHASMMAVLSGL